MERISFEVVATYGLSLLLASARVGPLMWVSPIFGGRLIPPSIKGLLTLVIALPIGLLFYDPIHALLEGNALFLVAITIKELLVGASLAFVVSLVIWAAQSAGWLTDQLRGSTMSELSLPQHERQVTSPLGNFFFQLTIVIFFAMGGHRLLLAALAHSYETIPLHAFPSNTALKPLASMMLSLGGDFFAMAFAFVAPMIVATLFLEIVVGWVNRFVPQMAVHFVAMPIKALFGIVVIVLSLSSLLLAIPSAISTEMTWIDRMLELLRDG